MHKTPISLRVDRFLASLVAYLSCDSYTFLDLLHSCNVLRYLAIVYIVCTIYLQYYYSFFLTFVPSSTCRFNRFFCQCIYVVHQPVNADVLIFFQCLSCYRVYNILYLLAIRFILSCPLLFPHRLVVLTSTGTSLPNSTHHYYFIFGSIYVTSSQMSFQSPSVTVLNPS